MKLHHKRACESEKRPVCITNNCLISFNKACQIFSESLCNTCLTNYTRNYALWDIAWEYSVRNMQEEMKRVRSNTYIDNQPLPRNSWGWLKELPPVSTTDTKYRPLLTNHCLFQHHQKKIRAWDHGRKLQDYISVNAWSMWLKTFFFYFLNTDLPVFEVT